MKDGLTLSALLELGHANRHDLTSGASVASRRGLVLGPTLPHVRRECDVGSVVQGHQAGVVVDGGYHGRTVPLTLRLYSLSALL